ncbi:MAG: hypothetical protein JXB62_21755 [Pirellulales bacterium]|nr:hypothetical protein [Pirellulales bacterium]
MSPAAESVIQRLDAARQKWWVFTLLTTSVMAVCLSLGTLLVFVLADALLKCSQPMLLGMFLVWLVLSGVLIAAVGRRLLRSQRSLEATARRVESEFPELGSSLINVLQLSGGGANGNRAFCHAAVDEAAARIGPVSFDAAAARESRRHRFLHCTQTPRDLAESLAMLCLLIAGAVLCHVFLANWGSAASRLITPWKFVPSVGRVEILEVTPGSTDVMVGGSLEIAAKIRNPQSRPCAGWLLITPEGEEETSLPMAADGGHQQYTLTLPAVIKPLQYRLEIGDSQTEIFQVGVRQKPTIDEVKVVYHYPSYLRLKPETVVQKHGDLQGPEYTVAELHIRPSVPIAKGHIESGVQHYPGRIEDDGMRLVVQEMPLLKDGAYTVHMFNDAGHTDPDPRLSRIRTEPDRPPTAQLLKPARQSTSAPGGDVPVMIRAGDDHGLGKLRLEMKIEQAAEVTADADAQPSGLGPSATPTVVREWTDFQNDTSAVRHYRLSLDPAKVQPGQTVSLRAVAWDRRAVHQWGVDLDPQQFASPWHSVRIVAEEAESAAALERLDGLREAVWRILEKQVRARVLAAAVAKPQELAGSLETASEVRTRQIDVQKATLALVESTDGSRQEGHLTIKRTLNALALGEMLQAVRQCDAMAGVKATDGFERPTTELMGTQDRIIRMLRALLDVARRAQDEVLAEMKSRPGGDLPPDVIQKLDEARKKLDEFLEQQKKVIEATENLAKTPVEDFTEEEEQLLKELAATEDDWSKFMQELHSDLSKLPEQDFANASLLSELVEIQTEIKMVEDALTKKTCDIAVPLEQLGAEMAEEIKTNVEKWLPDTPDRERWSQEESLTDADKEAPMAELPGELEDLIGELLEEEEDLFDEMEDISSSAADSLDLGAGWDVADGPISNMSAKGATGNRLPNTSEIGGRSGEGRSGKSSGEFVGEEAVGKGGRKTPSRLTPDPYVKGQIKDHSQDPTGGATGGGKESGQGGEGLEGPIARSPGQRDLQRLAGKQAALRNRAEGVDLQFQIMNFHHTDLQKMIELMAQVERDLKAGRYQSALRQRRMLADGLGNVKQYLEGEFEVRQDATANLPADVQKELLGSMQDHSPVGWEELNRRYFERLSTGQTAVGDAAPGADPSPPGRD